MLLLAGPRWALNKWNNTQKADVPNILKSLRAPGRPPMAHHLAERIETSARSEMIPVALLQEPLPKPSLDRRRAPPSLAERSRTTALPAQGPPFSESNIPKSKQVSSRAALSELQKPPAPGPSRLNGHGTASTSHNESISLYPTLPLASSTLLPTAISIPTDDGSSTNTFARIRNSSIPSKGKGRVVPSVSIPALDSATDDVFSDASSSNVQSSRLKLHPSDQNTTSIQHHLQQQQPLSATSSAFTIPTPPQIHPQSHHAQSHPEPEEGQQHPATTPSRIHPSPSPVPATPAPPGAFTVSHTHSGKRRSRSSLVAKPLRNPILDFDGEADVEDEGDKRESEKINDDLNTALNQKQRARSAILGLSQDVDLSFGIAAPATRDSPLLARKRDRGSQLGNLKGRGKRKASGGANGDEQPKRVAKRVKGEREDDENFIPDGTEKRAAKTVGGSKLPRRTERMGKRKHSQLEVEEPGEDDDDDGTETATEQDPPPPLVAKLAPPAPNPAPAQANSRSRIARSATSSGLAAHSGPAGTRNTLASSRSTSNLASASIGAATSLNSSREAPTLPRKASRVALVGSARTVPLNLSASHAPSAVVRKKPRRALGTNGGGLSDAEEDGVPVVKRRKA
ncbi:hypothetical protein T439DRAFT_333740 [Meredithblackwellia eburnea MCA 4105]